MQLMLNDEDTVTLRNLLRDWLPDLRREAAATDLPARELKHELNKRVALVQRLITELDQSAGAAAR